jgi:type I restriction enzyme R subunit
VVKPIDMNSTQLKTALEKGKDIIITTLQKFPVISESVSELKGKRFAVIIDEAHSSQSGESTKHLKKALSAGLEDAEKVDRDDFDIEDEIIKEIENRGKQNHISYFAFTATPKGKTLEIFGRKGQDGKFQAFHVYSMRQAIEEGFIIDVLKNYTTFKRYFKLQQTIDDDGEYEKGKVTKLLTSYVDLQPHAIETKTRIMLDHFNNHVINEIKGQARAMVVTRSRLHAVKFYLAFSSVLKEMGLKIKPLVAFSGTVHDPDTSAEHTENSLNGLTGKTAIQDALKTPEYRILVVANKFQTGFDEPLLHTMYVDKKLGGVSAVQTLSRLNRIHPAKTDTMVLDFVNDAEDIKNYYQTTLLDEETDPNKLYDLKTQLEQFYIFDWQDIEDFSVVFFDKKRKGEELQPLLDRVVEMWLEKSDNEKEDFRSISHSFVRLYGFLSQIISFKDVRLEKLYVFLRSLNRKLPRKENPLPTEVLDAVDLDSFRIQETFRGSVSLDKDDAEVQGIRTGAPKRSEEEKDLLSIIITILNETYGLELTDEDKVDFETIRERTWQDEDLRNVMHHGNSRDSMRMKFNSVLDDVVLEFVNTKIELYNKLSDPKVNAMLKQRLFQEYFHQAMSGEARY